MNREIHVPLRESLGVKFPRATRPSNFRGYSIWNGSNYPLQILQTNLGITSLRT